VPELLQVDAYRWGNDHRGRCCDTDADIMPHEDTPDKEDYGAEDQGNYATE
jgi:hypothetical protein